MSFFHFHHHHHSIAGVLRESNGDEQDKIIKRVVKIGLTANILLMAVKLITGIFGHSDALVADGFHSLNDIAADLIILFFVGLAYRKPDYKYPYGYGKYETFASLLIGLILITASIMIFIEGTESIVEALNGGVLERPDLSTVIVAVAAIFVKECLYRYTNYMSKKTKSTALKANAWHHRSDALATIATLIGVTSAHFMGEKWRILDPCASLLIAVFILVPAIRIVIPAFKELMEHGLPEKLLNTVRNEILSFPEVKDIKFLRGRKIGHSIILDIDVKVDRNMKIGELEDLKEKIRKEIELKLDGSLLLTIVPYV